MSVTYENGDSYKGEIVDGKRHGQGTYTSGDSNWTGNWETDNLNGKGTYVGGDGKYEGDFVNTARHGKGVFVWASGEKYEGEFQDDTMAGLGTYTFSNGNVYTGNWVDGSRNGQGTMQYANGAVYEGEWSGDKCEGKGKWTDQNGTYEGEFSGNQRKGHGTYTYKDGTKFEGEWDGDKKKEGKLTDAAGKVYTVKFDDQGNTVSQEEVKPAAATPAATPAAPAPPPVAVPKDATKEVEAEKARLQAAAAAPAAAAAAVGVPDAAQAEAAKAQLQEAVRAAVGEEKFKKLDTKPAGVGVGAAGGGAAGAGQLPDGWIGPVTVGLAGGEKVGKTALATVFVEDRFPAEYDATLSDSYMVCCEKSDRVFVLDVKDIGGNEEFADIQAEELPRCEAYVFAFSIVDRKSFDRALQLHALVAKAKGGGTGFGHVLVGLQSDKEKIYNRAVSVTEAWEVAKRWGTHYVEASPKTRENVSEVFQLVIQSYLAHRQAK